MSACNNRAIAIWLKEQSGGSPAKCVWRVLTRCPLCRDVKMELVPAPEDHSMGREERSLG